ncbi:hypothetical protein FXO37_23423 [Capsicum annuum]|nr:hypothetical protein FXO37_23423 [Capsicum annuum]
MSSMEGKGRVVKLTGCVKNYDWGRAGKESRVARLYACNSGDTVDLEKPYAEFWMGTHDSGPSYVVEGAAGVSENGLGNSGGRERNKLTLKEWIENNPIVLGEKVVNKWGTNLPFLFKVCLLPSMLFKNFYILVDS